MNRRDAHQESDRRCRPTCPDVDAAFDNLFAVLEEVVPTSSHPAVLRALRECQEAVKAKGTEKLREVLVDACSELLEAQGKVADLERELDKVRDELSDAKYEIAELGREVAA